MTTLPEERQLNQALRSRHISLISIGGIIGSAYFLGTGYLIHEVGPGAFLAYILGGIITFLTMSCLSELTLAVPERGSFIHFAAKYISRSWACGVGWSYWMTWVVYIPSECIAAGMIMNDLFPGVSPQIFAMFFGLLVTLINTLHVRAFGEVEFWFAIIKISALSVFCFIALMVIFGVWGSEAPEPVGFRYLWNGGGFFPNGIWVLFLNMMILLVNFQGSEIIGLSASEAKDASRAVPKTINNLAYRIICLYLIPTFMVAAIIPWSEASLQQSVFASALDLYGFQTIAKVFMFVVLAAAISCANSGLYACVRSIHALGHQRMAPKFLAHLNRQGVPEKATWLTLASIWGMLGLSHFFAATNLYKVLLGVSGFTGAICWISICWSQLKFRRRLIAESGYDYFLPYKVRGFPYTTHAGIWLQVLCLIVLAFNSELRPSLYVGILSIVIPVLGYKIYHKKIRIDLIFWKRGH